MSRSIHRTRKDVRLDRYAGALRDLQCKRRVKRQIVEARAGGPRPDVDQAVDTAAIPIRRASDYDERLLNLPEQDIRVALATLPPHATDGISEIVLATGALEMRSRALPQRSGWRRDPLHGRPSFESPPGVLRPIQMGWFLHWTARIVLFGYVLEDPGKFDEKARLDVLAEMLDTLCHEVAHDWSRRHRRARGRWREDDVAKDEDFAEATAREWTRAALAACVEARYASVPPFASR